MGIMQEKPLRKMDKPAGAPVDEGGDGEPWVDILPEVLPGRIRPSLSARRLGNWSLVLEARGIGHRLQWEKNGWHLKVSGADMPAALTEIRLYERENRGWPPVVEEVPLAGNTLSTLSVLILLGVFYNITRLDLGSFGRHAVDWMAAGDADAGKILDGQWWRLATSLTLHTGYQHLFANLLIGGFFVVRLCGEIGAGPGWCLLLLSGVLGNLFNALLQPPWHQSVGASTAIFGAVGALAALSVLRNRGGLLKRWPLPLAAGVALLGLLGTGGNNTDLGAHLFGFGSGLFLGGGAGLWLERFGRPRTSVCRLLAFGAALAPVLAWVRALFAAGNF
jgi:rhomboid protease GluP